jgi:hypothetical protein
MDRAKLAVITALDEAARAIVLLALDELTRPLGRREIEKVLGRAGITRRERERIVPALLCLDLVAIVPRDA